MDVAVRQQVVATCLAQPGATCEHPFGDEPDVYKVGGRMFAWITVGADPAAVTLKAEPPRAAALVEQHPAIRPGYHMNKRHWVTVTLDGSVPAQLLVELVEDSYDLVVDRLPRARRPSRG